MDIPRARTFEATWESVRPVSPMDPGPAAFSGVSKATATVEARSSRAEMFFAGRPLVNAQGALSGVRRMENQGERSLRIAPDSSFTGAHPPMATAMPSALASTRNRQPK